MRGVRPAIFIVWLWPVLFGSVNNLPRTRTARRARSRVGALGEATSSQNQVMTYPYYVRILKPSPHTIYHGQGLAWGSHPGSYRNAMSKSEQPDGT